MRLNSTLLSLTGLFALIGGQALAQQNRASSQKIIGPVVHVTYPGTMILNGPNEKDVDCGLMIRLPDNLKKRWTTCAFFQSADNNSQVVCTNTNWIPLDDQGQRDLISRFIRASSDASLTANFTADEKAALERSKSVAQRRGASSVQEQDVITVMKGDLSSAGVAAFDHFGGPLHRTCLFNGGMTRRKLGDSEAKIKSLYGDGWETDPNRMVCAARVIVMRCQAALQ